MILALGIFISALTFAALGIVPVQVSVTAAVVLMIVAKLVTLQEAYDSVDWPIIILLGAMIPVGGALETTGGADLIANSILHIADQTSATVTLILILVATMFLSDLVNNAAAVVLMAPIGHQSNTLVMGPGGYKFGDYWRMGLLLEVIVAVIAIPLILLFWPL
jgi:di/tricarboxylate transporter